MLLRLLCGYECVALQFNSLFEYKCINVWFHRAIMKMATVYPLPIYERLSESGLGISEVNDFFIDTDDALNELVGEDILYSLK